MKTGVIVVASLSMFVSFDVVRASAPPGRYVLGMSGGTNGVNGFSTVFDTKTKLKWEQTPSGPDYTWGIVTPGTAQGYCSSLIGGGLWRVPTVKELLTLIDYSQAPGNMLDPVFAKATYDVYWSADAVSGLVDSAWYVDFGSGELQAASVSSDWAVRCVQ